MGGEIVMNLLRTPSLFIAALAGAASWALSPMLTGHLEPWDAGGIYYFSALILGGLVSGFLVPSPIWTLYVGSIVGQLIYVVLMLPISEFVVIGFVFLLLWSLLFLGGGYAGSRLRLHFDRRQPAK